MKIRKINVSFLFFFYYFLVWPFKICYAYSFRHSISCQKTFSEWKSAGCKQSYRDLKAKFVKKNISFLFSVIYNFFGWPLKIWYVYYFTHSIGCTKQFSEGKSVGCKQSYRGLKAKGRDFTGYFNLSGSVFTTSWRHRVEVGGERGGHWFWLGVPPPGLADSRWYSSYVSRRVNILSPYVFHKSWRHDTGFWWQSTLDARPQDVM